MTKRTAGAAKVAPAPRKSGANIPDSQRHTVKLQLRVQPAIVEMLDAMCSGNRSDFVSALVKAATRRRKSAP